MLGALPETAVVASQLKVRDKSRDCRATEQSDRRGQHHENALHMSSEEPDQMLWNPSYALELLRVGGEVFCECVRRSCNAVAKYGGIKKKWQRPIKQKQR